MSIFSKILEVFTKEYRKETEYREFQKDNIKRVKLKSDNYNIEESIESLRKNKFKSNFRVLPEQTAKAYINIQEEHSLEVLKEDSKSIER